MLIFAAALAFIMYVIQPSLPDYEKVMNEGERLPAKVTAVEPKRNIKVNEKSPNELFYSYEQGGNKTGQMIMAFDQYATIGQEIQVRVLNEQAYPEGITPFRLPNWLWAIPIGLGVLGLLSLIVGVIKVFIKLFFFMKSRG